MACNVPAKVSMVCSIRACVCVCVWVTMTRLKMSDSRAADPTIVYGNRAQRCTSMPFRAITIVASEFTTDYCEISMHGWGNVDATSLTMPSQFLSFNTFSHGSHVIRMQLLPFLQWGMERAYISSHPTRCICTELAQIRYSSLDIG